jgi:hypothetical protein
MQDSRASNANDAANQEILTDRQDDLLQRFRGAQRVLVGKRGPLACESLAGCADSQATALGDPCRLA